MFSENLAFLRQQANLSQQFVASALGLSRATYVKLENGQRQPNLRELEKLSEVLSVNLEDLIGERPAGVVPIDIPETTQPSPSIKFDPAKLRDTLLYILTKVGGRPNVGETVIYKLLYFSDFDHYEKFGQSITGLKYQHNHFGPTPNQKSFRGLVATMSEKKELTITETIFHNNPQKKYLANVEPDLAALSGQEVDTIDQVISRLGHKTAQEITDLAHQDTPWIATQSGEIIDYELANYRTPLTSVAKQPTDEI